MTQRTKKILRLCLVFGIVMYILGYTLGARPQCPDNYSQAQVDESGCIVGASIGPQIDRRYFFGVGNVAFALAIFTLLRSESD